MLHPYYLLCFLPLVGNGKCILLCRHFSGHDLVDRFTMDNNEGTSYSYGNTSWMNKALVFCMTFLLYLCLLVFKGALYGDP